MKKIFFILLMFQIITFSCSNPKSNLTEEEADSLQTILEEVYYNDQELRLKTTGIKDSLELVTMWDTINKIDSVNLQIVTQIIDNYGWLSKIEVGFKGSLALFLVIQHSNLSIQEKYLSILKEAVKNKKADAGNLAYIEDRIAIRNGKKQIYGTQLKIDSITGEYKVLPIEDSINVNKRRRKVGLLKLEEYLELIKAKNTKTK